jgi:hypothetical protein
VDKVCRVSQDKVFKVYVEARAFKVYKVLKYQQEKFTH